MAEVIYTMPNMMTKARYTQGEREERIVEIYATSESLRDQHQDCVGTEEPSNTLGTVRSQQPDPVSPPQWPIRAVVVLLVLLSVALLAGLLGLAVQHKIVMGREVEQVVQRLKNVTEQHKTVSMEVEQVLQRLKNVTEQHKTSPRQRVSSPPGRTEERPPLKVHGVEGRASSFLLFVNLHSRQRPAQHARAPEKTKRMGGVHASPGAGRELKKRDRILTLTCHPTPSPSFPPHSLPFFPSPSTMRDKEERAV
ncbi:unnamed protein product [Boreogadus saida]